MQALLVAAIAITLLLAAFAARGFASSARYHYLISPYLDLDRPGERGSPYALTEADFFDKIYADADAYAGVYGGSCADGGACADACADALAATGRGKIPARELRRFQGAPAFAGARGRGWRTPAYYWGRHDVLGRRGAPTAWAGSAGAWRR